MRQLLERLPLPALFGLRREVPRYRAASASHGDEGMDRADTTLEAQAAEQTAVAGEPRADRWASGPGIDARRWSRATTFLAVAIVVFGILGLYGYTAESIVAIWLRSETFAHGFVVVPIALWLVWRQRDVIAQLPATPWWPVLAGVFAAGALWLAGFAGDALGIKQFAMVFMIQAAIVAVIGKQLARALIFPLAFLLFAVPAGEIFVPTLIDRTADFTVAALRWSGVPVYREANHFIIPSGAWSVVEACSGIRYIIASVMVGTIYAAIAYRSTRRRLAFLAASVLVPIVANWLRAYMIVMLAHLTNNRLAVGVDHIIYGWLFFGLVMVLLFWVGSFWQESSGAGPDRVRSPRYRDSSGRCDPRPVFMAAVAGIAVAALWLPIAEVVARPVTVEKPVLRPLAGEGGWIPSNAALTSWRPHYRGFADELNQSFERDGRTVGLYLAYFRNQEKGRELITSGNVLVSKQEYTWRSLTTRAETVDWAGFPASAERAEIAGQNTRLEAYRLYWANGGMTSSDYVAKALIAWSKLRGHGDDSALIVAYRVVPGATGASDNSLREFLSAMSPSIERTLETTRGVIK